MGTRKFLAGTTAVVAAMVAGLFSAQTSTAAPTAGLFGSAARPAVASATNDSARVELGVKFTSSTAGTISGIRFYKGGLNTGKHTATLWSADGSKLATGSFSSTAGIGWQTAKFSKPVRIKAGLQYTASYLAPQGRYAYNTDYFAKAYTNGALTVPANGGVYNYGDGFPTSSWKAANYWVDVLFATASGAAAAVSTSTTTNPPTTSSTTTTTMAPSPFTSTTIAPISSTSTTGVPTTLAPSGVCDVNATTANFAAQVSATAAGKTLCLASGNYGTWNGTNKAIVVKSQAGAAVSMAINFGTSATAFILDGVTVTSGSMIGNSSGPKNLTIRNSTFTGALRIDGVANSNILLEHNTHNNIDNNASCTATPARIHFSYGSETHSGVTVQDSLFDGGNTDGIQTGVGVTVLNNEFRNIREKSSSDCAHTDVIQLIDARGSVVRGNYVHHSASGIVAYDGVDSALIEHNVVDLVNGRYGIELYSDTNSMIRNNTLVYGTGCEYAACGQILLDRKSSAPAGAGTVIENNIASGINASNGSTAAVNRNNMVRSGASGSNFLGTPAYVGGATPTTFAGFKLAWGSAGKSQSTVSGDVGI